jgi:hypothetical protein
MKYIVVDNFTNQRLKEITFEIKTDSMMKLGIFFEKSCSKKSIRICNRSKLLYLYSTKI